MKITCFLPCRKGSERVKNKNIRSFAEYKNGLIEIKLKQLNEVEEIDEIVLTTNDEEIIKFATSLNMDKLTIHKRSESLSSSQTSTDELVGLAQELIPAGHILWTHVTSPFLNSTVYKNIISEYKQSLKEGYDSLMTTSALKSFIWNEEGPINYDRTQEKWPRTQTLPTLYEINSGVFLADSEIYSQENDRIGKKVKLFNLDKIEGHDIDWPEDFIIAEAYLKANLGKI